MQEFFTQLINKKNFFTSWKAVQVIQLIKYDFFLLEAAVGFFSNSSSPPQKSNVPIPSKLTKVFLMFLRMKFTIIQYLVLLFLTLCKNVSGRNENVIIMFRTPTHNKNMVAIKAKMEKFSSIYIHVSHHSFLQLSFLK